MIEFRNWDCKKLIVYGKKIKKMKKENWIKLDTGIRETLKGKVVDTYAFCRGDGDVEEESHLIIKFTDGTFICVGLDVDDVRGDYSLDNKYCHELSQYRSIPYYLDITDKFHLEYYIRQRIEMGVIEPMSDEDVEKIVKNEMEERRNKRYKEYLKLKAEFETKDN